MFTLQPKQKCGPEVLESIIIQLIQCLSLHVWSGMKKKKRKEEEQSYRFIHRGSKYSVFTVHKSHDPPPGIHALNKSTWGQHVSSFTPPASRRTGRLRTPCLYDYYLFASPSSSSSSSSSPVPHLSEGLAFSASPPPQGSPRRMTHWKHFLPSNAHTGSAGQPARVWAPAYTTTNTQTHTHSHTDAHRLHQLSCGWRSGASGMHVAFEK